MDKLYIVIPAYNESANIGQMISQWYPIVEAYNANNESRLVIINDGSKDNTYELICNYATKMPLLIPLTKENGGHGSAVLYGYRYALKNEADYIFQTDSDGQTTPDEFAPFWDLRDKYDAIIGKRLDRKDGKVRKLVEKILCFILRIIFNVKVPDANAPYRLVKRELLEKYIDRLPENYFLPNVMMTTYFTYYKENSKFINISFESRKNGINSINFIKIIKIGVNALRSFTKLKREMN